MGVNLRKYTEVLAKNKRSYQLRTSQMKLPVRKIEPAQYVDSKDSVYPELPKYPILGNIYKFRSILVRCEVSNGNCGNAKCVLYKEECGHYVSCIEGYRPDKTNICLIPYHA